MGALPSSPGISRAGRHYNHGLVRYKSPSASDTPCSGELRHDVMDTKVLCFCRVYSILQRRVFRLEQLVVARDSFMTDKDTMALLDADVSENPVRRPLLSLVPDRAIPKIKAKMARENSKSSKCNRQVHTPMQSSRSRYPMSRVSWRQPAQPDDEDRQNYLPEIPRLSRECVSRCVLTQRQMLPTQDDGCSRLPLRAFLPIL